MREDQWLKFTPLTNKQGRRKMVQIGRHGPIKEAYDAIMNTFRFHCKWEMGFIRCICSGILRRLVTREGRKKKKEKERKGWYIIHHECIFKFDFQFFLLS
jgi:uncharacterized protein Veg